MSDTHGSPAPVTPLASDTNLESDGATLDQSSNGTAASAIPPKANLPPKANDEWTFEQQLIIDQKAREERGLDASHGLSLIWHHLSLRGVGGAEDIRFASDFGSMIFPYLTLQAKKASKMYNRAAASRSDGVAMQWRKGDPIPKRGEDGLRKGERYLIHDFNGCLKPGEMMLVVGRPGSGCSAFLKTLAGQVASYAGVEGEVYYGNMLSGSAEHRPLASDVLYVSEEEWHDPNLLVGQTMDFALRQNTLSKKARPLGPDGQPITASEYQEKTKMDLLKSVRMAATHDTKVGDQYVRGVSGGERKRLTLIEALTGPAHAVMWDNPTRGLDANTANLFTSVCRQMSDIDKRVNVMTLYQAGNSIYQQFDKVCVIAEGQVLYYGPRKEARPYFESLGFVHMEGANTADFLTAVTVVKERQIAPEFEGKVPTTPAEFAAVYKNSAVAKRMEAEVDTLLAEQSAREAESQIARASLNAEKAHHALKSLPQRRSFPAQIKATVIKDFQQRWGDQWSFWARQITTFIQAWIIGSVYYNIPATTGGLYLRAGVLFVTIFYPVVLGLAELHAAFNGRGVLAKHKSYNMYRASTVIVAKSIVDAPIYAVQTFIYVTIVYWMSGLRHNAGFFFTCFLFTWMVTMIFATLFRSIGYAFNEFNDASKVAGTVFIFFVVYGGFVIYTPSMKPWFGWIRWINPLYYTFEAVISNELTDLALQCVPPQLAPYGPGYTGMPAGCAVIGGTPGSTVVSGSAFLEYALRMSRSHVWRNFGIIIALWILIAVIGMVFLELLPNSGSTQEVTLYKRGGGPFGSEPPSTDEENLGEKQLLHSNSGTTQLHDKEANASESEAVAQNQQTTFTWKDVCYTVRTAAGKDLQLLDHVSGYCRAGTITALMGSSGAGKTTLMDVLAARKSEGVITGEVKLNGHSLPVSFQRTTGYCEQLDIHLPQATVREALEFSALLRQPRHLSEKEKLAYVNTIIELLELDDIADAIIGEPGAGLGVEQRKRLTIGVELVSRPSLLFLDEPTSGLDGQSSYVIVGFLRKLASVGQAILCTIHQPSAALFAGFDNLLLLKRGGKTVYFGAVKDLSTYFKSKGVDWPEEKNPAEYMIDIVSGDTVYDSDWGQVWLDSDERKQMLVEMDALNQSAAASAPAAREEDGYEFAATRWTQLRVVTWRATVQVYRNVEYTRNKFILHIATGLISGFSWFQIGNSLADLQNRMFSVFMFVFIAPGVMVQTQPKFIKNRDIFEAREKKAKFYAWHVFCFSEIAAEIPYLLLCACVYWICWYPASGLDLSAGVVGPVYLQMTFYEFLYTGMGQFIAAYAPNPTFAAEVLPLFFGILITFTGILIPYPALTAFWRYWMYYLDPFNYLMQGLLTFPMWDAKVECKPHEFGLFNPPSNVTCGEYLAPFLTYATGYLNNPNATTACEYCGYAKGSEYLNQMNITRHMDGWRGILITLLFCFTSYGLVFLLLKLRTKKSKTAKS